MARFFRFFWGLLRVVCRSLCLRRSAKKGVTVCLLDFSRSTVKWESSIHPTILSLGNEIRLQAEKENCFFAAFGFNVQPFEIVPFSTSATSVELPKEMRDKVAKGTKLVPALSTVLSKLIDFVELEGSQEVDLDRLSLIVITDGLPESEDLTELHGLMRGELAQRIVYKVVGAVKAKELFTQQGAAEAWDKLRAFLDETFAPVNATVNIRQVGRDQVPTDSIVQALRETET